MPENIDEFYFAFDVFAAFALFENQPTEKDLQKYFGIDKRFEIKSALDTLLKNKLITRMQPESVQRQPYMQDSPDLSRTKVGRFKMKSDKILFDDSESGFSHRKFLSQAILHAEKSVEDWYDDRDLSHFNSSIISVEKQHFIRCLNKFKDQLREFQGEISSSDANQLVRVNLQIYPV